VIRYWHSVNVSIMVHATFKFHDLYFLSDVLVISYVLLCTEVALMVSKSAYTEDSNAAQRQRGIAI